MHKLFLSFNTRACLASITKELRHAAEQIDTEEGVSDFRAEKVDLFPASGGGLNLAFAQFMGQNSEFDPPYILK